MPDAFCAFVFRRTGMGRGVPTAPDFVEPVGDDPVAPPVGEPTPPTDTPTDPETSNPEPGFDPAYTLADRIDITDSGQTVVRSSNDPGTFGSAYVATAISGDEYWEYDIQTSTPNNATFAIGVTTLDMPLNGLPGERATELAWWSDGTVRQNNATLIDLGSAGRLARGDLAGIAINAAGEVFLYKNCSALNAGATVGSLVSANPIYPFVALYSERTRINMNFSLSTFGCTVPDGFFPIGQVPGPTIAALTTVESGLWVVPDGVTNLSEVVIVAGGGSGGSNNASGGGGAGGLIYLTNVAVTPGESISYTVGPGGVSTALTTTRGTNGGNSVFGANTAIGGGAGGAYNNSLSISPGADGGSGGGGGMNPGAVARVGGAGTAGQGFAGGSAYRDANDIMGGAGGGAGGAAANSADGFTAPGGAGLQFATFAAYGDGGWFASGGNSGQWTGVSAAPGAVLGGGGYAGNPNGLANTGGGGLGGGQTPGVTSQGGNGGSGVILIAY